jgi:hypothetical protein
MSTSDTVDWACTHRVDTNGYVRASVKLFETTRERHASFRSKEEGAELGILEAHGRKDQQQGNHIRHSSQVVGWQGSCGFQGKEGSGDAKKSSTAWTVPRQPQATFKPESHACEGHF